VPDVSIITPTYDHAAFLGQCIDSVLGQTVGSWEQIIVDDGSADGTADVVRRYRDPRIRYVRQEHVGLERLPETYNRALAMCRAPLIAILEGDDYWPPDKLQALAPAFDDPGIVLAYGFTEVVGDARGDFPPRIPGPDFQRRFAPAVATNTPPGRAALAMLDYAALTFTYPCSVILRRAALDRIGGFQHRPGLAITDHPTFLRLSLEGRFHFEPRVTGYWRVHGGGATVQRLDEILEGVYREVVRFHDEFGARVRITEAQWRAIERRWARAHGGMSMRQARRLMLQERWSEARAQLRRAIGDARSRTGLLALVALAGSVFRLPVEWAYRFRRRPWLRRLPNGELELVFPDTA
jgi:glycosyltransferase involved in cell wall biosynthesis